MLLVAQPACTPALLGIVIMTEPVTGPFTKHVEEPHLWEHQVGYRQKPPYTLQLAFSRELVRTINVGAGGNVLASRAVLFLRDIHDNLSGSSYDRAYARLVGKLGETASMGVNLVQWKQADRMIRHRATTLSRFSDALKNRNPIGVAVSLGISVKKAREVMKPYLKKDKYGYHRAQANLWLEFWFGWKPLLNDIFGALDILTGELPSKPLRGSASFSTPYGFDTGAPATEFLVGTAYGRVKVGCNVKVKNPNLRLLQQLGLLNPATVLWDAIPWSFVLGWILTVDLVLNSWTAFAGLDVSKVFVVKSVSYRGEMRWHPCVACPPDQQEIYKTWINLLDGGKKSRVLSTSVPLPSLRVKKLGFAPARALTAISLLIQKLPKK